MICDFVVGDEVVCVDDSLAKNGEDSGLCSGEIYVISDVFLGQNLRNEVFVNVVGAPKGAAFRYTRFRKLQKKKTDISAFKTMLKNDLAKNKRELEEKEKEDDFQPV